MKTILRLFALAIILIGNTSYAEQVIDLTHGFGVDTLYWPTANSFKLIKDFAGKTPAGIFYAINDYSSAEHVGTHLDAPLHFAEGHKDVASVPLTELIGSAIVVDVRPQVAHNANYMISIDDFKAWEKANGKIPPHTIILLNTGFSRFWPARQAYMGTKQLGAEGIANLHFPGLSPDAAKWLVSERSVKALGIDTASIDYGQSKDFLSHQILTRNDIPFFENVADLSSLPAKGFKVYALPMKIEHGTGAPLRIIALVP